MRKSVVRNGWYAYVYSVIVTNMDNIRLWTNLEIIAHIAQSIPTCCLVANNVYAVFNSNI